MSGYLAMGGYAVFVWPAYGVAIAGVGVLVWRSLAARAEARRLLAELEAAERSSPGGST
jgi:heme exporter protein CcmD